jgi:RNA polymerase sigma-70 factor (ECF subfamily)
MDEDTCDMKELVCLLKEGKEEGFRLLVRRYRARLLKIAYSITLDREESLDIVQEVFLKVYKHIGAFRGESRLSTWLHRMTVNECLNWRRRWKRRFRWHHESIDEKGRGDHSALGARDHDPQVLYQKREMKEALWTALRELPVEARAVFALRELQGLSYDEIAMALNIKRGTVSSRLFHARKRLRQGLLPYFEQE